MTTQKISSPFHNNKDNKINKMVQSILDKYIFDNYILGAHTYVFFRNDGKNTQTFITHLTSHTSTTLSHLTHPYLHSQILTHTQILTILGTK